MSQAKFFDWFLKVQRRINVLNMEKIWVKDQPERNDLGGVIITAV